MPFALAVWLTWGLVNALIETGSIGDYLLGIVILGSISMVLGYLLWRSLSVRTGRFDFPGSEQVTEETRDSFGNMYLMIAYAVVGVGGVVLLSYEAVKGLLGILGFFMGAVLLLSGFVIYRSRKSLRNSIEFQQARLWYPRSRTTYFVLAAIGGVAIYLMYKLLPSWKSVSPWDVGGVLFLLFSSCIWVFLSDSSRSSGNI